MSADKVARRGHEPPAGKGLRRKYPILLPNPTQQQLSEYILDVLGRLLVVPGQVMELRALEVPRLHGKPHTVAGYFDDPIKLAEAAVSLDKRKPVGVYVTLNPVNPALLARGCNRLVEYPTAATADTDIVRRVWLPIDIDPVRASGISSTPDEIEAARQCAVEAEKYVVKKFGVKPDLRGFSGNGFHILYRIDFPNDDAAKIEVKRFIDKVADHFPDERVKIDRGVFNAARIWKLYGTTARKGDDVPQLGRVHRRALLIDSFSEVPGQC